MGDPAGSTPYPNWRLLYEAAVLELDRDKMLLRIADAERAVMMCMEDFARSGDDFQSEALVNALNVLQDLRNMVDDSIPTRGRYSKLVLLIDDDPADLKLFAREVSKLGFEVVTATTPETAMTAVMSGTIGCLVTDQAMPIPGDELVRVVQGVRADIGVIFLTGAPEPVKPVPEGAIWINKDHRRALHEAILACMSRWKVSEAAESE